MSCGFNDTWFWKVNPWPTSSEPRLLGMLSPMQMKDTRFVISIPYPNSLYFSVLFHTSPPPSSPFAPPLPRSSSSTCTQVWVASQPVTPPPATPLPWTLVPADDLRSHVLDHSPKDSDVGVPLGTSVTVFCDKDVRTVCINKLFEVSIIKKGLLTHEIA